MRYLSALVCLLGVVMIAGCSSGVSEADAKKVADQFSKENYDKAMKDQGHGKELEEEKAREAAYKASAGGSADQDAGQH